MGKTLYAILGVEQGASTEQIRAAVEAARAKLDPADTMAPIVIKEAWDVLGQPERRARYDASLRAAAVATASTEIYEEDEGGGSRRLMLVGVVALLVAGGWYWQHARSAKAPPAAVPVTVAQSASETPVAPALAGNASAAVEPREAPPAGAKALSSAALFAQASQSVVRVNAVGANERPIRIGSGVVTERGGVITNCHVALGGGQLKVVHASGSFDARVSVADEEHDLCKLDVAGLSAPPVPVGRASSLAVGQKVYAIGSPQGLDLTLSDGMVSSLRTVKDGSIIQTTAPVSPGSSGGGLFDEFGQLVGIVTFQSASGQNLNFAVPAEWIGTLANTSATGAALRGDAGGLSPPDAGSRSASIVGAWQCYGPLTGRGLNVVFTERGVFHGEIDGRAIGGNYALYGKTLNFGGDTFEVEELSATRMVMTKGEGRRLVCSR